MTLIKDETETLNFISKVLKPLIDDEVYITLLCARKKYCPTISSSEEVLSREIIRNNDPLKIIRKLKKISIVEDIYTDKSNNVIPSSAMALYILLDPRSTIKAYGDFIKSTNDWMSEHLRNSNTMLECDLSLYRRLDIKLFSAIHKNRSRPIYFIIDIDNKDKCILEDILLHDEILPHIKWISETHGGYHIILERNDVTGNYIHHLHLNPNKFIEILKEPMTPLPGSLQGDFLVKEVKI